MSEPRTTPRYIVSNIGCGYAVHDTQASYERLSGEDRKGTLPSTNAFTSRIVETMPTRHAAQRLANKLNGLTYGEL